MMEEKEHVEFQGGYLTALSVQKANPDRLNLFVDDQFAFGARREVIARHMLKKGMEVTPDLLRAVWRDEECYKARDKAANYLSYRARSQKEMADYLAGKGFDEDVVEQTIEWLLRYGYLNDEQFAKQWVESRMRSKPRGKAMLRWELKQKGVARDEVEDAITEFVDDDVEIEAAMSLLQKKIGKKSIEFTLDERKKLAQFLARRGFPSSVIYEAIRRLRLAPNLDNV